MIVINPLLKYCGIFKPKLIWWYNGRVAQLCDVLLDKNNAMHHCLQTNILRQRLHASLPHKMSNVKGICIYFYCAGNFENYFVQLYVEDEVKKELVNKHFLVSSFENLLICWFCQHRQYWLTSPPCIMNFWQLSWNIIQRCQAM